MISLPFADAAIFAAATSLIIFAGFLMLVMVGRVNLKLPAGGAYVPHLGMYAPRGDSKELFAIGSTKASQVLRPAVAYMAQDATYAPPANGPSAAGLSLGTSLVGIFTANATATQFSPPLSLGADIPFVLARQACD